MRSTAAALTGAAVLVGAAVLTGCSTAEPGAAHDLPTDGPLVVGGESGVLCLTDKGATEFAYGSNTVANRGSSEATIFKVTLQGSSGFELTNAYLVQATEVAGSWSEFPPPSAGLEASVFDWTGRVTAVGAAVKPGTALKQQLNLVAHLKRDPQVAHPSVEALAVDYKVDGRKYRTLSTVALRVVEDSVTNC